MTPAPDQPAMWRPIRTCPDHVHVLCGHITKKWIRFGRRYPEFQGRWYYSGTSERSQYAQVEGDEPTHWMPIPPPPGEGDGGPDA